MAAKAPTEDDVQFFIEQNEARRKQRGGPIKERVIEEPKAKSPKPAEVVLPEVEWPSSRTITIVIAGAGIAIAAYLLFSRGEAAPLRKLTIDEWQRLSQMMHS